MPASRKIFLLSAALLVCHFVALALHATIASNIIEFVLVLLVVAACFEAASRTAGYAQRFWRLMGAAFALYALGQAMATYYDSVLHASFDVYWPSDILFLFHVAPMALALFLGDDSAESRIYRWQRWLDFLQIGIVSLSAYFFFLYLPLVLPHSQHSLDALYAKIASGRGLLIAGAFILRATLTNSKLVKSLFGRMALFLVIFIACEIAYDYVEVWRNVPFGTWYELLWSVPRTLMVWLAVSWKAPVEAETLPKEGASEPLLLAQFAHIAFPLLVLAMATQAIAQQLKLAVAAVLASFACSSLRLFLGQRAQSELLAQQKRGAEAMRLAEAKFRGLLESAPDPLVAVNLDGRIVVVNAQAEKTFGYKREELLGQPMDTLVVERLREKCSAYRTKFFKEPDRVPAGTTLEIFGLRKDGTEFPVEINLSLLETEEGLWGSAAIRDLTERRKLESQFRQAQKMESIGTLSGGIAHDFNNLLTVILSYSNSLAEDLRGDSKHQRAADQIHQAAERGAALTRQMLAFSRQQVFQVRVLNLNDIIRNLLKMLQRIIGEHIEITTALADDLKPVKADPGQLEQILMNLSVNARDAMPKGGKLALETSNVVLDEDFVRLHVGASAGPQVLLTVSDTGTGMDSATQARIFEPFFTTKGPGQGTGLGLAMVYGVVKQSGGSIWVKSKVGLGTTFHIYLPQAQGVSETPAQKKPQTTLKHGSETILVVEDDPGVRELVSMMLTSKGYTVLTAQHPSDAESVCQKHSGNIHLLLTDMILPGASGREIAQRVSALRPGIKVLYMSGYTDDALVRDHGMDESFAFLQKPFSQGSVAAKVREVLDSDGFRAP
ncbi:MAG TPA: PAS domain S-box protein [Candidatus Acidoferrum sp.]|nr:PAS domain S-box protein [Candidatus Acidoferrum sp.]